MVKSRCVWKEVVFFFPFSVIKYSRTVIYAFVVTLLLGFPSPPATFLSISPHPPSIRASVRSSLDGHSLPSISALWLLLPAKPNPALVSFQSQQKVIGIWGRYRKVSGAHKLLPPGVWSVVLLSLLKWKLQIALNFCCV